MARSTIRITEPCPTKRELLSKNGPTALRSLRPGTNEEVFKFHDTGTLDVWASEMQRIGVVDHDLIARFDRRIIEQFLEEPADGLEHPQKGNTHGNQTC